MSKIDYAKQAQEFYSKAPIIILGSGASVTYGMSGMAKLAEHLIKSTNVESLSQEDEKIWGEFCEDLKQGIDLEITLQRNSGSEELTSRIIKATWNLLHSEDYEIFKKSLQNKDMFQLSKFIEAMFQSSLNTINIVTTNYDRLAEYACDQVGIYHYTGFTHGFFRQLMKEEDVKSSRRVNIWKVHGSLDWFESSTKETIAISNILEIPDNYEPLIVTPGTQKYQKTHFEPFRTIINYADRAINDANSYLCIGYGFNDEHIQPKLVSKCKRLKARLTIITHTLSESAKKLISSGELQHYLAIERGDKDDQSIVWSSLSNEPITVEKNIWSLEGYLSLIT